MQLCGCVSFWVVVENSSQNENTFWILIGLLCYDSLADVYFIRPNTLLLCIFLFCIFLLYRTDPQVEAWIRLLLKDKYVKLCQKCKHQQSHFVFLNNACWVSLILRNNLLAKIVFSLDPNFLLLCISFLYYIDLHPYSHIISQKYQDLSV